MATSPIPISQPFERKARVHDVEALGKLINHWAEQRQMLPKTEYQLFRTIRSFWVLEEGGEIIGCSSLRIYTRELGEVCSVAIAPGHQGRGLGKRLVDCAMREAKDLGLSKVFCLTYQVEFFEKIGFAVTRMENLPEKVWADCVNCPFQDNCNETAMILAV